MSADHIWNDGIVNENIDKLSTIIGGMAAKGYRPITAAEFNAQLADPDLDNSIPIKLWVANMEHISEEVCDTSCSTEEWPQVPHC